MIAFRSRLVCLLAGLLLGAHAAEPLRVFIRAGEKTHGPDQHDHPRFLTEWKALLAGRGAQVDGALTFPSAEQLARTDVVVVYARDGMHIVGQQRTDFEAFLRRGGGLVVIHDGVVSAEEHDWAKRVQGGAWIWDNNKTKWYEGDVGVYFVNPTHPIARGISNFDWVDEIYYDLDMAPDAHVIATCFQSVFVIAPQLWTYEKTWEGGSAPYRAFVSIPGHNYAVFNTPHYRALLLRGIAWAGKRANVDELCKPEELASLLYPEGGPTPPERAAAKIQVHPEFDLALAASEPLVEKVISLDWDPQGRLWVAETPEYPNGRTIHRNDRAIYPDRAQHPENYEAAKENRPARDRISILTDTDGDGRMDRKAVFYEGLELVTSLVFYQDGVIVAQAPDILRLRDTDADGKADKVEKLFTGFGVSDTHAVISNFRWGMDGWIYSAIGYSAGDPRSGDGARSFGHIGAGIFRFRPDGSALEQVAAGSCNTWGLDFAPDGEAFYNTATCSEHMLHIVLPEKVLAKASVGGLRASTVIPDHQKVFPAMRHTRQPYLQIDLVGMFTASAGACVYNGGAWPEPWNQMIFHHEPTVNLVHNDVLVPQGTTFLARKEAGREETEFLAGLDPWFRPIHSRVGPDGALYVVDFYNQAAVHNDTRGPAHGAHNAATRPDRDHHFARIWRVQHKQAQALPSWSFATREPAALVPLLEHPNGWVRQTAHRLLSEGGAGAAAALGAMARPTHSPIGRIHALHVLENLKQLDNDVLLEAINDPSPVVRKNALQIIAERDNSAIVPEVELVKPRIADSDPRARLQALIALGTCDVSPEIAQAVVAVWPDLRDKYLQTAALGVAARDVLLFVRAVFRDGESAFRADLLSHLTRMVAEQPQTALPARLVELLAGEPASADGLKQVAIEALSGALRSSAVPEWTPALQSALASLLRSARPGLAGASLPLVARWDRQAALAADLKPVSQAFGARLLDASLPDEQRGQIAANLLGVHKLDAQIVPTVAGLLNSSASAALQQRVIEALGSTGDPAAAAALIGAFQNLAEALREAAFGQLMRRGDWAKALTEALAEQKVQAAWLGPSRLHRLRTHPDRAVASRAAAVIDAIRGPVEREKNALIAQFRPVVERAGGNVANGHKLFSDNCATCHIFKNEGRDLAPNLTGMGAHGAADLLVHILDPNRLVEPNFLSVSIETTDDLSFDGVVARENRAEVVLRNATGDYTIRKQDIRSRRATSLSLMPEGFEALGAEALRDVLAFICADENRFRILDLTGALTANTGRGVYSAPENTTDAPTLRKYGLVMAGQVPFDVVSPQKAAANTIVLRGGSGYAKGLPQRVEVKVGVAAQRLHFLGGVGGWGWPSGGEETRNLPVVKATLQFTGGATEEMVFRNAVEFADWINRSEVPGSTGLPDLAARGQVRWFSKEVRGRGIIERLTLESYDNSVAPTIFGITAELAAPGSGPRAGTAPAGGNGGNGGETGDPALRVLISGGGSSHDFTRWFNQADTALLRSNGLADVRYTDQPDDLVPAYTRLDVLIQSSNQPFKNPAVRQGLFDFAQAGKGLVLLHPGLWYNWPDWPEYNQQLCGGGSRGHNALGDFEVIITQPDHPLARGVPAKFTIRDELYWFEADPQGAPLKVVATAFSAQKGKAYPIVFTVDHAKARVVGITLGHDGAAHEHPAYQRLLRNAVLWAAGRNP
jgi:putative membrane-bound dehydrogenase-like protein